MKKKWWEGIIKFLCGFWWLILIIIALALLVYFTRNIWLRLFDLVPNVGF